MSRYKFSSNDVLSDEGGMGITWKALDDHLKRDVVIKTLRKEMLSESKFTLEQLNHQLIDEAINQAKVTHENIAKVYDYYTNQGDNQVYLVFEYIVGKGLDKYPHFIGCDSKNLNEVLNIFEQILKGIICAHKNNIIHRDIKLNNIMYCEETKYVKVIDFGISKVKKEAARPYTVNMYGNLPFFAPERIPYKNLKIDREEKFDIFAVGVTFFYMLTGCYPYKDINDYELPTPRVSDYRDDINEELDELICSMIQIDPKNRLEDLTIVLDAIIRHQSIVYKQTTNIPSFKGENQIRDNLHDYISVSNEELKIINHPVFQRLRNINMLGTTYLVYPGATHTRFAHSIGVMHLASRIFDEIIVKNNNQINWDFKEIKMQRQMLRIAALLHDIGHGPFSHVSDKLFSSAVGCHETMSANLIRNTSLSSIIDQIGKNVGGFNHKEIAGLIEGKNVSRYNLIKRIFSGTIIDADRMDYLLRDSLMLGVKYGKFDLEHLIRSMNIDFSQGDPMLAIERKGIYALEEFMLARHFMFTQVYTHKTRRIYDKILEKCMSCVLPSNILPVREEEFINWDDHRIYEYIRNNPSPYNDMFMNRGHLKLVYEKIINSDVDDKSNVSKVISTLETKKYKDTEVIIDYYIQEAITYIDEMGKPMITVIDKNQEIKAVHECSPMLININKQIEILRIYSVIEKREEILEIIKGVCENA